MNSTILNKNYIVFWAKSFDGKIQVIFDSIFIDRAKRMDNFKSVDEIS